MSQDSEAILREMDLLWQNFENCRAHFPAVPDTIIGQTVVPTAPYYRKHGFKIRFCFDEPLTKNNIDKINDIGHWINQNFVIRLCALMESHQVLSNKIKIDDKIDGSNDVDLIRRLRNYFAHSSGKYKSSNPEQVKTLERLGEYFHIKIQDIQDFPLAIDTVLQPLFNGCKRYVEAKFKAA